MFYKKTGCQKLLLTGNPANSKNRLVFGVYKGGARNGGERW